MKMHDSSELRALMNKLGLTTHQSVSNMFPWGREAITRMLNGTDKVPERLILLMEAKVELREINYQMEQLLRWKKRVMHAITGTGPSCSREEFYESRIKRLEEKIRNDQGMWPHACDRHNDVSAFLIKLQHIEGNDPENCFGCYLEALRSAFRNDLLNEIANAEVVEENGDGCSVEVGQVE